MKPGSSIKMNKPDDYDIANLEDYQKFIGKLIYFVFKIESDIMFIIWKMSKYNSNPRKGYFQAAKTSIHYLKSKIHLELVYKQRPDRSLLTTWVLYGLIKYGNSNFVRTQSIKN